MGDQPDVLDQGGRAKRLVLGLIIGAACAAIAYTVCRQLTANTPQVGPYYLNNDGHNVEKFVWYMTAFFGALGMGITLAITNARAKKKWHDQLVAKARVVE